MNCRAVALALLGWYLMIPPNIGEDNNHHFYAKAALLSEWSILQSFDTAKECENEASAMKTRLDGKRGSLQDYRPLFATCIATDDPRLK